MRRRAILASLGSAGAAALAGCAGDDGDGGTSPTDTDTDTTTAGDTPTRTPDVAATVETEGIAFAPKRVTIDPGQAVRWTNEDGADHDVTAAQFTEGAVDWDFAGELPGGAARTVTFDEAGVYQYYCTIHGEASMCGAVLVGDVSLASGALPCESGGDDEDDGGYGGDGGSDY